MVGVVVKSFRAVELAAPRRGACRPEFVQFVVVALRIHALPVARMPIDREIGIGSKLHQRSSFQYARFVSAEVIQELAAEEEITAVNPFLVELRLLLELQNFVAIELDLAKA